MNLDRVTITGADDSVQIGDMLQLSKKYPFVEWGILLSASREGTPRYPSLDWMVNLKQVVKHEHVKLSGHLCGQWVRALCRGNRRFQDERSQIISMFQRMQLNFHADPHDVDKSKFLDALEEWEDKYDVQFIVQFDDVNNDIMTEAYASGINIVPLFDTSGGAGIYPDKWPPHIGEYCGYAGGLHPDKIDDQIRDIEAAVGPFNDVWIDVETHVRSPDDKVLDLDKVETFLKKCQPHVWRQRE